MRMSDASNISPELLLCLALLHRPAGLRAFCQLLERDEQTVLDMLSFLERNGLLAYDRKTFRWIAVDDTARAKLGSLGAKRYAKRTDESLVRGLFLLWSRNFALEGSELICLALERLLHDGSSAGVLLCLDVLLAVLKNWRHERNTFADNVRYLAIVREVLGLSLYMSKRRRATSALLPTAFTVANAIGDKRIGLQLRLIQVCRQHLSGGILKEDPQAAMREIMRDIDSLGDSDILAGTTHGIGLQYYTEGAFAKSIEHFRSNMPRISNPECKYFTGIGLFSVAASACSLGRFGNAIGALLYSLHHAVQTNAKYNEKRSRIQAADILLRAGRPDAAMEIMGDAFSCCDPSAESRLLVWGLRNIAFYHFQKNNIPASYALLCDCVRAAKRYAIHRPFFAFPDLFAMLWSFQEHDFPPISGYNLDDMSHSALREPCVQSQGIALRIKARLLLRQGGKHEAALALLEESRRRLSVCANPMEYARSGLDMAKSLRALERTAEADGIFEQSCSVLKKFKQYDCPRQTDPAITPRKHRHFPAEDAEALATRCTLGLNNLSDCLSFSDRLQWMVDSLRDILEVERAALFALEDNGVFTCLAARDFTQKEIEKELPRTHTGRLANCVRNARPLSWRQRNGACLCLPLKPEGERVCVLFAHSVFLVENILDYPSEYFLPASRAIARELRLAFRAQRNRSAERQIKKQHVPDNSGRLELEERVYYGPAMSGILEKADKAAAADAPILILGETGVGKEELARRIHAYSGRQGQFVPVHPASIPEHLFESELFGHEKGAFTGAHKQKTGLLELADQGTFFIDEIGELPHALQVKLLRVLQEKKFLRVGGIRIIQSDFRLVSATHQDLKKKVRDGSFREDLYYRIAVVPLVIPPLRERPDDILDLAQIFHARYASRYKRALPPLTPEELDVLRSRSWHGNVRELKSVIERGVILYDPPASASFIQEKTAPVLSTKFSLPPEDGGRLTAQPETLFLCEDLPTMKELQRRYIKHVLSLTRGKIGGKNGALSILGMKQSNLYAKIREYGLDKTSLLYGRTQENQE